MTVVWFTGLSGSGKTTLAERVRERLGSHAVLLDSDAVRTALGRDGYTTTDRDAFYRALAQLAALLSRQGHVVLVAATAPRRAHRELARSLVDRFVEVWVNTPLAECEARDVKGLYARARRGEAPALPGVGVRFEEPITPDVVAHGGHDDAAVATIVRLVLRASNTRIFPHGCS
jgi:adenylylsulfate kinase